MNYELAKKLKEAGFKQEGLGTWPSNGPLPEDQVYAPTLSELIEACGDEVVLWKMKDGIITEDIDGSNLWCAGILTYGYAEDYIDCYPNYTERGDTPEEAAANLWLALNQKPQ